MFNLQTFPKKVVKNTYSPEDVLLNEKSFYLANKKVRIWRTFDKNSASTTSKAFRIEIQLLLNRF